jgi:putative ABC transport system permease protein
MPLLRVVLRFAVRNRLRTLITALGVGTTLLAFLLLRTLVDNWYTVNESSEAGTRMIIRNKISIMFPLFTPQAEKLRAVPGVLEVSWLCWFGGKYKGRDETFPQQAVDSESFLRMYPEYNPPEDQKRAYLEDMTGALVGAKLAEREGWTIGDRVVLEGTYYPGTWDFTIRGIYPVLSKDTNGEFLFFHYKHFNEKLPAGNRVQRLLAKVSAPQVAKDIDRLFENSPNPTKSLSEFATQQMWASWSSGVVSAINAGTALVLLVLALVLGNSMAMATREATREYACMRAIGYKPRHITLMVLGEGAFVACIGIAVGLAVAPTALHVFTGLMAQQLGGEWDLRLEASVVLTGIGVGLGMAMLASAWPAWRSGHLTIVDSLRRVA